MAIIHYCYGGAVDNDFSLIKTHKMSTFKIGDTVRCVDNKGLKSDRQNCSEELRIGVEYTVEDRLRQYNKDDKVPAIQVSDGSGFWHPETNFVHA